MRKAILYLAALVVLSACNKDDRERLFEMFYPSPDPSSLDFDIPAGLTPYPAIHAKDFDFLTRYEYFLNTSGYDSTYVNAISSYAGRVVSLEGLDLDFVRSVSVRICDLNKEDCSPGEEVFYIDYEEIRRVADNIIQLQPSLINAKRLLSKPQARLEILFSFYYPPPFSAKCRLEMSFEAVH